MKIIEMKKSLVYILFILGTIFNHSLNGQIYNFQHFSVENGFPQATCKVIIQDDDGYMWVGTQVGAVKFDGHNYKVYKEREGLASHIITDIYKASNNELWIGTRGGVSLKKNDTIQSFTISDGLPDNLIIHIWEDQYATIWIMTDKGLVYFSENKLYPVELPKSDQIVQAHYYFKDSLYLSTNKGIIVQTGKYKFEQRFKKYDHYFVNQIAIQKDTLWIGTFHNGLLKVVNNNFTKFDNESILGVDVISTLLIDSQNKLWVGTEGNGFFKRNRNSFTSYTDINGMRNTAVLSLYEDAEGNIWAGGRNGVVVYNPNNPFKHYREANQSTEETLFGMLQDKKGNYWFATYGAGLSKFDGNKWMYFKKDNGLKDNRLFDIIEDSQKNKWIATSGFGLVKYNGDKFTVYDGNNGFISDRIYTILFDAKGILWGGSANHGPFMFDGTSFKTFGNGNTIPKIIMSCYEDKTGQIWFGSVGDGLIAYDGREFNKPIINSDIQPTYIRSITADDSGNIWFGSASKGVCKLIKTGINTYNLISISTVEGLNSNNVYFVINDKKNQIWAGTEKGVNKIILDQNQNVIEIKSYGRSEGFIGAETAINGAMVDNMGNVWFSSLIGATMYEPGVEKKNIIESKTHITGLKLFYQEIDWKKQTKSLNNNQLPINLKLPYQKNHLTFDFIGLSFTNPEKVFYQYKLEGLDQDWSPKTKNREAVYANVPPGKYTFKVKSCNNDGVWNQKATTYHFEILAPFWQSTWFYLLISIFVVAAIFVYINLRVKSLRKTKMILEQKVLERTSEIEKQKQEIQEKNEELNQRTEEIAAQRDELNVQNHKIEKLFNEQTESIKYAKHIQQAVLSSTEPIKRHFKDHFVIFQPHSIVSGDFYYVAEVREWIIIAAVDSTGHGVPGGFMSMLGMSFLNEIVYPMDEIQSNIILNKLRKYIINSLKQEGRPGEQKEGMEMSLTAINTKTYECQFSGAQNPLLVVRQNEHASLDFEIIFKNENKSMYYLPPDNMPISIFPQMETFTQKKFKLFKGDKLFYFSDGFSDQFNGSTRKKLSKKTFFELLFKYSDLSCNDQKQELGSFYDKWRGTYEKIDDVLVMGIEI